MSERLGKYEVIRTLGHGAMGEVLLARDTVLGREVALKTIRSGASEAESRTRFFREAQAAGQLAHPHAVTVHDFGEHEGRLYLAMEYVPGEDLSTLLRGQPPPASEVLEILAQVAEALAAAHALGMVHRDVKPSNIRVQRLGGRPHAKLMDFGIARTSTSDLTGTGVVLGTFGYMAPEYLQSGHADARADLFALGVILHEALAGQNPFHGDTTGTVIYRILHEAPPRLDPARLEGVSPSLQALLDKVLEKDPQRRLGSALELAEALRAAKDPAWVWVEGGLPTVRSTRTRLLAEALPEPIAPRRPRWPWVALLVAGALGAGVWGLWPAPSTPAPQATPLVTTPQPAKVQPTVEPILPVATAPPPPAPVRAPVSRPAPSPAGPTTLAEAEAWLERDPQAALAFLDRHLQASPRDERALALRLVALYELKRTEALRAGLLELRQAGIPVRGLMVRVPRFGRMLEAAAADGTLPRPRGETRPEGRRPWPPRLRTPGSP